MPSVDAALNVGLDEFCFSVLIICRSVGAFLSEMGRVRKLDSETGFGSED